MTHSNHRFTMLSADDVALCRAHSEAIDDARESRALQRWADAVAPLVKPVMSVRAFEVGNHMPADLPMPPSYWDDLEHWLKTLAPAKPAAEPAAKTQDASGWRIGSDVPPHERVGLWHLRVGFGDYLGVGSRAFDAETSNFEAWDLDYQFRKAATGTKLGYKYDESKYAAADLTARLASTSSAADGAALIGANPAVPAQQPAQKAKQPAQKASTHSVCIESYGEWTVGEVVKNDPSSFEFPRYWLPCDESGWVTHVPKEGAKCPVPKDILCAIKYHNGDTCGGQYGAPGYMFIGWEDDIIAWRPIAQS